jgi:O-antigen ligase
MAERRSLLLGLAALVVLLAAGISIGAGSFLPVAAILAPLIIAALVFLPVARPLVVLVASSSFVFVWAAPHVALGSVDIYLGEALLLGAVAATLLQISRDEKGWSSFRDPVTVFVGLYAIASLVAVVVGLGRGTSVSNVASGLRPQVFAGVFLVCRYALDSADWRKRLIVLVSVLAVATAAAQAVQVVLGPHVTLFALGSYQDLIETDAATGFLRVRPPGLYLEYVVACMSAAYLIWGPRTYRVWAAVVGAASLAGVLLSFNRNMLVGFVVGLVVAGAFSLRKRRFVTGLVVLLALGLVGFLYLGGWGSSNPIVERFASITDPAARSVALQDRQYENALAEVAIAGSPVLGIGWGTEYGASAVRVLEGVVAERNRDWIHNQYLASWMRMGLLGMVSFVGIIVATIGAGVRAGRSGISSEFTWLGPATVAAMVALATSATVDLVILNPSNVPVFMLVGALGSFLWTNGRPSRGEMSS